MPTRQGGQLAVRPRDVDAVRATDAGPSDGHVGDLEVLVVVKDEMKCSCVDEDEVADDEAV